MHNGVRKVTVIESCERCSTIPTTVLLNKTHSCQGGGIETTFSVCLLSRVVFCCLLPHSHSIFLSFIGPYFHLPLAFLLPP